MQQDERQQLQVECLAMLQVIKSYHEKEQLLRAQNELLARQAVQCGFDPSAWNHLLSSGTTAAGSATQTKKNTNKPGITVNNAILTTAAVSATKKRPLSSDSITPSASEGVKKNKPMEG
jgi:hypothetical protein